MKILNRIVALLMIPCLLADQAWSHGLLFEPTIFHRAPVCVFSDQALSPLYVAATFSPETKGTGQIPLHCKIIENEKSVTLYGSFFIVPGLLLISTFSATLGALIGHFTHSYGIGLTVMGLVMFVSIAAPPKKVDPLRLRELPKGRPLYPSRKKTVQDLPSNKFPLSEIRYGNRNSVHPFIAFAQGAIEVIFFNSEFTNRKIPFLASWPNFGKAIIGLGKLGVQNGKAFFQRSFPESREKKLLLSIQTQNRLTTPRDINLTEIKLPIFQSPPLPRIDFHIAAENAVINFKEIMKRVSRALREPTPHPVQKIDPVQLFTDAVHKVMPRGASKRVLTDENRSKFEEPNPLDADDFISQDVLAAEKNQGAPLARLMAGQISAYDLSWIERMEEFPSTKSLVEGLTPIEIQQRHNPIEHWNTSERKKALTSILQESGARPLPLFIEESGQTHLPFTVGTNTRQPFMRRAKTPSVSKPRIAPAVEHSESRQSKLFENMDHMPITLASPYEIKERFSKIAKDIKPLVLDKITLELGQGQGWPTVLKILQANNTHLSKSVTGKLFKDFIRQYHWGPLTFDTYEKAIAFLEQAARTNVDEGIRGEISRRGNKVLVSVRRGDVPLPAGTRHKIIFTSKTETPRLPSAVDSARFLKSKSAHELILIGASSEPLVYHKADGQLVPPSAAEQTVKDPSEGLHVLQKVTELIPSEEEDYGYDDIHHGSQEYDREGIAAQSGMQASADQSFDRLAGYIFLGIASLLGGSVAVHYAASALAYGTLSFVFAGPILPIPDSLALVVAVVSLAMAKLALPDIRVKLLFDQDLFDKAA